MEMIFEKLAQKGRHEIYVEMNILSNIMEVFYVSFVATGVLFGYLI